MNKEEFIRRKRIAERQVRTADRAITAIFITGLFALAAFAFWQERHPTQFPVWPIPSLLGLLFAAVIAGAPKSSWNLRRRARQNGLTCPSCHGVLLGPVGEIAIASGNCAHCGGTVFSEEQTGAMRETAGATVADSSPEPAQAFEPAGLMCPGTREEFQLRERAMRRGSKSPMLFVLVLISALAIASRMILTKLKANPAMGRPVAIGMLLAMAVPYAALFFLASSHKRRIREYGLACPVCQGPLTILASQLAKATGCCSHCGELLFDDVSFRSGDSLEKRKEFASRKRAVDSGWKSARVIFIPVAVVALVLIFVACVFVPPTGTFYAVPLANVKAGMIIGAVGLMYCTLILAIVRHKRRYRKSGLACPSCRRILTLVPTQIAVATGICSHCGGSIFGDEPSHVTRAS